MTSTLSPSLKQESMKIVVLWVTFTTDPWGLKVSYGWIVTVVAGFLLACKHIVKFELPCACPKHQEPLTSWEGTTHESTLILVCLPKHWDGTEPGQKENRERRDIFVEDG